MDQPTTSKTAADIQQWLVARLARLLRVTPDQIDVTCPFDRLGLDSATAVGITLDLEDFLQRDVDPAVLYDYTTVQTLSAHLGETVSETGGS